MDRPKPPGLCAIAMGINYMVTSISYKLRFALLGCVYQGFEWVNVSSKPLSLSSTGLNNTQALSPKPSFGVWWEIELMVMPSVWYAR
jgi:hypothetical protein